MPKMSIWIQLGYKTSWTVTAMTAFSCQKLLRRKTRRKKRTFCPFRR